MFTCILYAHNYCGVLSEVNIITITYPKSYFTDNIPNEV